MSTQIVVVPIIKGELGNKIYERVNQRRTESSKKIADKLTAKYKDKIKISVNCSSW